jgi:Family of unknown function (DUF5995)
MDKSKLDQILVIEDLKGETVLSIIGRMEMLLDLFKGEKKYENFAPFLHVYQMVTKKVQEKNAFEKGFYNNYPALEDLDVYFAHLFFKPLRDYINKGEVSKPWQVYFEYCSRENGIPFVQLLLGINAHINADLNTCLLDLKYGQKHDFDRVNNILGNLVPQVMEYLAFHEHDIYGLSGIFLKQLVKDEFTKVVVKWRKNVWENAQLINNMSEDEAKNSARVALIENTERLGEDIIDLFSGIKNFINPEAFLENLHKLQVRVM